MKRFSLCAIIIIALMCSLFSGISFASSAEFEELVPDDWELLYKETFDNDTGQPINLNTIDYGSDHPYYASNWTYTTVNSPGGEPEYERAAINESGVLKLTHPSSGTKGINVNAILKNPIDLMTDADYYLIFDGNFPGMGNVGSAGIELSNSNSTMSNTPYIFAGVRMNNNNPPYVPSAAVGLGGSGYTIDSGLRSVGGGSSAVERTMLVQFSIRRGQESTIRYRLFLPGETRTFTPDFWDGQRSWNLTGSYTTHTTLDRIVYRGSHNSGSRISNYFDNVYIYKAIPVCSYSSKLNGTAKVINDAVIGHTMTILDPSSDDITVISKGWYDLSTEPPSLITDDFEYTIPNSMLGKKIKAEITVDNNGVVTTYEPFIGYVRAPIDYTRLLSQMSQSDKTYTQWEDWTNPKSKATELRVTTFITINADLRPSAMDVPGSVALITAHYSADGVLKDVYIAKHGRKLGDYSAPTFDRVAISIKVRESNGSVLYVEPGDYFKSFVWLSSVNAAKGFEFDIIKPLPYNNNTRIFVNEFNVPTLPEE